MLDVRNVRKTYSPSSLTFQNSEEDIKQITTHSLIMIVSITNKKKYGMQWELINMGI